MKGAAGLEGGLQGEGGFKGSNLFGGSEALRPSVSSQKRHLESRWKPLREASKVRISTFVHSTFDFAKIELW